MAYINISIATYTRNPKAKDNVSWLTPYKILKNRLYCPLSWLLLIAPPLTVAGRHSVPHKLGGLPVILINFLDDHMCTKRLIIATTPSILSCFRKSTTGAIMQIIYWNNITQNILAIVCSSLTAHATIYNISCYINSFKNQDTCHNLGFCDSKFDLTFPTDILKTS